MRNSRRVIFVAFGFIFLMFSSFSQHLTSESKEIEVFSLEQVNLPNLSVTDLWDSNGSIICSKSNTQENPKICSNEDDGAIIVWRDRRDELSGGDIYAQRFHKTGTRQWTANGTAVCTAINRQYKPEICSDGLGGAFIAWVDERAGDQKIYIQRVTELESKPFTANGTIIKPLGGDQSEVKICSDGTNGAFIVWVDDKNGDDDIFAQRIDQDGNLLWLNETEVCTESSPQNDLQIINDGQGGLIITWEDSRGISDIYAQKLDSNGNVLWAPNGVLVCNEEEQQLEPQLCGDGLGGVIITWYDYRDGIANIDIYAQRINSGGTVLWNSNGSIVNVENNEQWNCKICSDGNGGAIVTWYDFRSGIDYDIYAQKINSNGNRVWLSSGIPICIEDGYQYYPEICSDGFGGAVIAWIDLRGLDTDIYSQRIDASSNTYWSSGGTPVTVAGGNQEDVQLIPDNFGGVVLTWEDARGADKDIYSQRLKENPIVTINSPVSQALFSYTAPSFNVEYLVSDLDDMWYTVNGGTNNPIITNGSISQSIWNSLGNGTVTIQFYADDVYGTEGYSEVVVHKDILGPSITINDPENNQEFKDIIPSYSITVEDGNLDTVWYTLNGGPEIIVAKGTPIVSVSKPIDEEAWNALNEGSVTIQFHANDTLGNPATPKERVIHKSVTISSGLDNIIRLLIIITIASIIIIVPTVLAIVILKHKRYMRLLVPPKSVGKFSIGFQENKGTIEITHEDEEMYKVEIDVHAPNIIPGIIHPINEDALKSYLQDVNEINTRGKKRGPNKDKDEKYEKYSEMEELMKVGEMYYSACIPTEIHEELESTSLKTFELRLETDFLQYPWEIFHDGKQFMGLKYNLGRIIVLDPKKRHRIKYPDFGVRNGVTFLIIGDPEENLPWAKSEAKFLRDELKKIEGVDVTCLIGQEANSRDIGKALLEGYDFIHYCGHAGFDKDKPHKSGIYLSNRLFKAYEIKNIKMKKPPILAFINGCESSKVLGVKETPYENQVSGLASSFYQKGINYIGSLWKVDDKVASNTALKFYFDFLEGYPMGESLRNARNFAYITFNKENSTWASYVLYGDPTLKLKREEEIKEDKKSKGKIKKKE